VLTDIQKAAEVAWKNLIDATVEWSKYMDQFEKVAIVLPDETIYMGIDRSVHYPDSFEEVDSNGKPLHPYISLTR
jgi:hypothetical protein